MGTGASVEGKNKKRGTNLREPEEEECFGQECQTDDIEKELASLKRELMDLSWNLEDAKMKEDESEHSRSKREAILLGSAGYQGMRGPPGLPGRVGVRGKTGEPGEPGPRGFNGTQGEKGKQGVRGEIGMKGPKGEDGPKGLKGPPGYRGYVGRDGREGQTGPKGFQGYTGYSGQKGKSGKTGVKGQKGEQGLRGNVGPFGPQGEVGRKGEKGMPGPNGKQGDKGEIGLPGFWGMIGNKGEPGLPGMMGPRGQKGEQGDSGEQGAPGARGGILFGVNVPDIPRDEIYPSPHPNLIKRNEIYQPWKYKEVVNHVVKAPPRLQRSYDDLIAYLVQPFRHEMQKLRAIFVWMCTQQIDSMSYKGYTEKMSTQDVAATPMGYFKLIKHKRASYATFFALLCRKAGIKCVVIKGISKSMGYNVGDRELSNLRTKWNAVYIKDSWRLIHPLWACKSVIGKADYTSWTAFSEQPEETVEGWTVQKINDFFFLTDPLDFIHFCFPDDPGWQLLANQYPIQRYIHLPFVQEAYFRMGFRLLSQHSCIMKSMNGQVEIVFRVPQNQKVQMNSELLYSKKNSTNIEGDRYKLDRFVIMSKDSTTYTFLIRFPHEGTYKLSVFGGGLRHTVVPWLADFQLKCDKPRLNVQPLPVAPWIGFGVTYAFEDSGLANPTERNGVLYMKVFHDTVLSFDITRPVQIEIKLKHNTLKQRELEHRITWKKSPSRFDIFVKIPQSGDYVVRIFIRDKGSRKKYRNCINYLITTDDPIHKTRKGYEDAAERNLRNCVKDVTSQRDIDKIKNTIQKFKQAGLDDKGEYTKASVKLEHLEVKRALLDGINARNRSLLVKAIKNARDGGYSQKLEKLIKQAEETLEEIQKLGLHPIPNLNKKIVSELVSYKIPHQIVFDMCYATFILLGENENDIRNWDYMKGLMKKTGKKNIMDRFRRFRVDDVPTREIGIAQKLVVDYDEDTIRKISIGATSLFNWLIDILQVDHKSVMSTQRSYESHRRF